MGKKKGAALVMVIAVTSILIILSLSILQVSTSSFKNDIALERINQVRLFAESGIEQAIAQLKNSSNISVPVITSADNIMTCNVAITTYDSAKKQYKIVSSASGAGFSKTITAVYQKSGLIGGSGGGTPEQVSDLVNNYLIKNAVTLFVNSAADNVFNWYSNLNAANNAITIFGNMYLSGNNINFTPDILYLYGNIMYQGDSSIIEQMKNNKGTINGIIQTSSIPPSIYPVIDTSSINKVVLYTSGGKNLIGYTTNQNSNLNDINQIINNSIYKNYANNRDVYKIVVVEGDLTIEKGTYSNYIIYCTGRVYLKGDGSNNAENLITLNNSAICANKGVDFQEKIDLTMDNRPGIPVDYGNIISDYLGVVLTERDNGGIVDWQE